MAIKRRDTKYGPRFDVEWRLPDRSKRYKTFKTEREARVFEATIVTRSAIGEALDPHAGRVTLTTVCRRWLASRPDLSPKVRRGYEDNWRLRIQPRFGRWPVAKIDHESIQHWVNEMSQSGLSPRTVRWVHSVLKMCLDHAVEAGQLPARNPAARTKFPPLRTTLHTYLTTAEVAALTLACGAQSDVVSLLAYSGLRFGELVGLNVEDVDLKARRIRVRRSITQVGGKLVEGNPKTAAGLRSVPIPERLIPLLTAVSGAGDRGNRRSGHPGVPGWASRTGSARSVGATRSRRSVGRRCGCTICAIRLARRAGADLRLLQKTMGHASIIVTAHIYADLYDDELDGVASALDALDDVGQARS